MSRGGAVRRSRFAGDAARGARAAVVGALLGRSVAAAVLGGAALVIASLAAAPCRARADEPTFAGEGQGTIVNGDEVRARERALDEALRRAVDAAVAASTDLARLPDQGARARARIASRAREYVLTYRVLEETAQAGAVRVKLAAQVATSRLARELGAAVAGGEPPAGAEAKPKLVVCLDAGPDPAFDATAARRALVAAVAARGFDAIPAGADCTPAASNGARAASDGAPVASNGARAASEGAPVASEGAPVASNGARAASEGAPVASEGARATERLRALAASVPARVVGAGAVAALLVAPVVSDAGPIRGTVLRAAHADVQGTVLDRGGVSLAEAAARRDAWGVDAATAGSAAVARAVDELVGIVARALPSRPAPAATNGAGGVVSVHVAGARRYVELQALLRALSATPGVAAVVPRRFDATGVDVDVRAEVSPADLAAALARAAPEGVHFTAEPSGERALTLRVSPE